MTRLGAITGAMIGGSVALAPLALATLADHAPGLGPLAAAMALGSIFGGLGWLLYYIVLAESGPAKATVALYLVPAFAVIYGVVLLGEPLTAAGIAGLALVVSGSWLVASQVPPGAQPATPHEPIHRAWSSARTSPKAASQQQRRRHSALSRFGRDRQRCRCGDDRSGEAHGAARVVCAGGIFRPTQRLGRS